ncbi:hypothetical protein TNCV_4292591 [Trichonephila clavipes]|uniref:Uncharacterized protein n=1 Tax=Trichonephila clavipes TaxID=2585209 RepID=A0A8X6V5T6_TRICX|nr:hypothetical protein TNCV_4292591 [Trichonephila clavipes]
MDFTEINSRWKRGELLGRIDRQNSRFRTTIIKFGLHASFVELESTKSALNEDWWCRAGRGNAVKTRRVEQAVVSWPLPKNYSSRSYESSLDGAASECSNK